MKKLILLTLSGFALWLFSSCYTLEGRVGTGASGNKVVKAKNHYVVYGLAPIATNPPEKLAAGAENYSYRIQHTFVDGLINFITSGLYNPTTTTVTK